MTYCESREFAPNFRQWRLRLFCAKATETARMSPRGNVKMWHARDIGGWVRPLKNGRRSGFVRGVLYFLLRRTSMFKRNLWSGDVFYDAISKIAFVFHCAVKRHLWVHYIYDNHIYFQRMQQNKFIPLTSVDDLILKTHKNCDMLQP